MWDISTIKPILEWVFSIIPWVAGQFSMISTIPSTHSLIIVSFIIGYFSAHVVSTVAKVKLVMFLIAGMFVLIML